MRRLQDGFDSRRLTHRLDGQPGRIGITADDRCVVERRTPFFRANADAQGRPGCSYEGGADGFVRVNERRRAACPSEVSNGMFRSLGDLLANAAVALFFDDFELLRRLRINDRAHLPFDDPPRAEDASAQPVVRMREERAYPDCPRDIHRMLPVEPSPYLPRATVTPPVPAWKRVEVFLDVSPRDGPARDAPDAAQR